VASSFFCVWLHALGVHKVRHGPFLGLGGLLGRGLAAASRLLQ